MAQGSSTAKADKLMQMADKKATKFDWFGVNKHQNQEDASELYARAAAQYKIIKEYGKAGLCYSKAAQCCMAADNEIEAKQSWREAGKCYRHIDFRKAIDAYKNAIQLNLDADRFGQAARLQEEIGDMLADDEHFDEAIEAFEQSADYYEAENDTGNKNKRLLKVAHMCGKAKKWEKAIKIFESTAKSSVDSNLLRWKVKEYLFKSALLTICMMADDDRDQRKTCKWGEDAKRFNERYCDISDIYASGRECKLIINILEALPDDINELKDCVAHYDKICKIDNWTFELIYFIQKYMEDKLHAAPILDDGFDEPEEKENDKIEPKIVQDSNPYDQVTNKEDLADAPDLDGDLL